MGNIRKPVGPVVGCAAALVFASSAWSLDILLTNDDGYQSGGINALRSALIAAGHNVTVVAPAGEQSGKGGSINTNVFNFTPGVGLMQLTNHGNGVWSLAGSPVDSVKAGLDIVLKDSPPDLIVSGLNRGENLGKPGSNASGTEGAALHGTFRGIPSIAASVQVLFSEASAGFPSTSAAYAPAADFVARTIDALEAKNGSSVLPKHVRMLNINFPVPYEDILGVKVTSLADGSGLELPLFDPKEGFPSYGIPPVPLPVPSCADAANASPGTFCFAAVGLAFSPVPDAVKKSDLDALEEGYITITPYDADMTGLKTEMEGVAKRLDP